MICLQAIVFYINSFAVVPQTLSAAMLAEPQAETSTSIYYSVTARSFTHKIRLMF